MAPPGKTMIFLWTDCILKAYLLTWIQIDFNCYKADEEFREIKIYMIRNDYKKFGCHSSTQKP